jgi:predicted GTPase
VVRDTYIATEQGIVLRSWLSWQILKRLAGQRAILISDLRQWAEGLGSGYHANTISLVLNDLMRLSLIGKINAGKSTLVYLSVHGKALLDSYEKHKLPVPTKEG